MVSSTTTGQAVAAAYDRFAGACAMLAAIGGVLYSIAFVFLPHTSLKSLAAPSTALFLVVGGLLTAVVLLALYQRLRATDPSFALLGLLLGMVGAFGTSIHGAYDLANALHPPSLDLNAANVPNAVDPRGILTFGLTGLGLGIFSWLILRGGQLPRGLGTLGAVLAVLLVVIYLVRLIYFTPTTPVLVAAGLTGIVVQPTWLVWLGLTLRRGAPAAAAGGKV